MAGKKEIKRVLIANRSEIALRILRAVKEFDMEAVVVYEKPDNEAYHIRLADDSILIGDGPRKDYLDVDKIIWAARKSNSDAIHPGYGFLSENPELAAACEKNGIIFVGPPSPVIRNLGNKVIARQIAEKAGIPVLPGTGDLKKGDEGIRQAIEFGKKYGYPLMLKASAGGGGRGIRKVINEQDLLIQLPLARAEAQSAFKNDAVYIEKCIEKPRHIEVQVLCDGFGNFTHLGTRDCSIQRRHQKLLEIAPATLPENIHRDICEAGVKLAKAAEYLNAGTVEFLLDSSTNEFWFMEMNTRLQVEHTVTEEITGVDIIREQLRIANGRPIRINSNNITFQGRAIEVRINAEDPKNNFIPEGGKRLEVYQSPGGPGVRLDGLVYQGYKIPTDYDSLMVKLTVRGFSWEHTVHRLKRALSNFLVVGPKTTIPFYQAICEDEDFINENFDTGYIDTHPHLFHYNEPKREIAKLAELIAEVHTRKVNPYTY